MKPDEKPLIQERITRIVKMLRTRDEMRLQDLAEVLGYEAGTITRIMSGHREWKVSDLVLLAEFFEVPVSLFFEDPQNILVRSQKPVSTESSDDKQDYLITDRTLVAA